MEQKKLQIVPASIFGFIALVAAAYGFFTGHPWGVLMMVLGPACAVGGLLLAPIDTKGCWWALGITIVEVLLIRFTGSSAVKWMVWTLSAAGIGLAVWSIIADGESWNGRIGNTVILFCAVAFVTWFVAVSTSWLVWPAGGLAFALGYRKINPKNVADAGGAA